jgi:hypothetical protein
MAEVLGRADGYCKGKSGSLHISAKELGVVLTSTIVGGELSLAPGVALAQKMGAEGTEPGGIVAVFFGDGAACEGIFHESLNLAVLGSCRCSTSARTTSGRPSCTAARRCRRARRDWAAATASRRSVDGNDVEAVHAGGARAVAAIRADRQAVLPRADDLPPARALRARRPGLRAIRRARRVEARDPIALLSAPARRGRARAASSRALRSASRATIEAARLRAGLALARPARADDRRLRLNPTGGPRKPQRPCPDHRQRSHRPGAGRGDAARPARADVRRRRRDQARRPGAEFGAARVRNTPLAEGIIAGTAVGAAAMGLRPVVDLLFAPFLTLRWTRSSTAPASCATCRAASSVPDGRAGDDRRGWGVGAQHNHNLEAMVRAHAPG